MCYLVMFCCILYHLEIKEEKAPHSKYMYVYILCVCVCVCVCVWGGEKGEVGKEKGEKETV